MPQVGTERTARVTAAAKKMAPENGAISRKVSLRRNSPYETASAPQTLDLQASKTEVGEVAVAHCDAGGAREEAVDRGHQAVENPRGRGEAGRGGFGHFGPLF